MPKRGIALVLAVVLIASAFGYVPQPAQAATSPDWYNSSWDHRKPITINSSQVDGDLTDFPVTIHLTDPDLAASAQTHGDDILFTASDGTTKLDHEIESFNSSTGELWAHVKTNLSATEDTKIYIYYGNSGASNQENVADVWSNGYEAVYHLKENASGTGNVGVYKDSTGNEHNGTDDVSATGQDGQIDGGQQFNRSAGDGIFVDDDPSLKPASMTLEAWYKTDTSDSSKTQRIFEKADVSADGDQSYQSFIFSNNLGFRIMGNDGNWHGSTGYAGTVQDNWQYFAGTYDGSVVVGYQDDTRFELESYAGGMDTSDNDRLGIGARESGFVFSGNLDEARISSAARSDGWLTTTYTNQNDPTSFYTLGDEETPKNPIVQNNTVTPQNGTKVSTTPAELSINVSDSDFPDDTVTVEFFDNSTDTKIGEDVLTSNGTATTTWDVVDIGNYTWYATATDELPGNTTRSEDFTFEVVNNPPVLNDSTASPSGVVVDDFNATLSINVTDQEIDTQNVTVTFVGDGQKIGNTTVTDNGQASVSWEVDDGVHVWYAKVEDTIGDTDTSETFVFGYNVSQGEVINKTQTINQTSGLIAGGRCSAGQFVEVGPVSRCIPNSIIFAGSAVAGLATVGRFILELK